MTIKKLAIPLSDWENTLVAGNTIATYAYEYQRKRQVPHGMGIAVLQVLKILGTTHPNELRRVLKESNSSPISIALDHLEDLGMVKRERNQNDRRCVDITITQKGKEYLREIGIDWKDVITDELIDKYSEDEMQTITQFLNDVNGAITKQVQLNSQKAIYRRI